MMPLQKHGGVFRIASELRKHDYSVMCLDMGAFERVSKLDQIAEILSNVVTETTLWVGFSTSFFDKIFGLNFRSKRETSPKLEAFLAFIRTLNPDIKIIAGGSRYFPLERHGVTIFKGYSDKEIVDFTKWCSTKKLSNLEFTTSLVQGTEFKEFSSSQIRYVKEDLVQSLDAPPIEISRGCIFKCKFCAFPLNGKTKGDWVKHGEILLDELNYNYDKFGITHYTFTDDTYNDSLDKLKYLHDTVFSKLKFQIHFSSYLRLDLLMRFPESIEYLKASGLRSAMFGIETINHQSAKAIGKGVEPYTQLEYIRELKQNAFKDILISSGFILGLPYDTFDTLQEFDEFLSSDRNYLDSWHISALGLTPPNRFNNTFYSEFDLTYEKYGYEVDDFGWFNKNTGLSYAHCYQIAETIMEKSKKHPKCKFAGFSYNYVRRLGIPESDIITLSRTELESKYNLGLLSNQECETYVTSMLNLSRDIKNLR
jgi:hypothetical protein